MIPFSLLQPESVDEARALLDADDPSIRLLGGGTALMLLMRSGLFQPQALVSLRRLAPQYRAITTLDKEVRIGAMTSLSSIEHSAAVRGAAPVVSRTMQRLSNVRVRNVATIGGHLAHGDPHMDLPAVLTALNAEITLLGDQGERRMPVESIYRGYFETSLAATDLIVAVHIPMQGDTLAAYMKCTTRSADDWPALGVAVTLTIADGTIDNARVVIGAATDRPTVVDAAAAVLRGTRVARSTVDVRVLREAGDAVAESITVRADAQGSAAYKRELARVYVGRAISAALATGTQGN